MEIIKGLKNLLQTASQQLKIHGDIQGTSQAIDTRNIYYTQKFQTIAASWGLTEADAQDVYAHGYLVKENMLVKKYNGYELGIYYFKSPQTGQPVVTSIWKRDRR